MSTIDVIDLAGACAAWRASKSTALGSAPGPLADDVGAGALAPDFQLLDGGGAEGVGGAEQDAVALGLEAGGEFADGGGLAGAVHAHHQDHGGRLRRRAAGPLGGLEDFEQMLADQAAQFGGVVD